MHFRTVTSELNEQPTIDKSERLSRNRIRNIKQNSDAHEMKKKKNENSLWFCTIERRNSSQLLLRRSPIVLNWFQQTVSLICQPSAIVHTEWAPLCELSVCVCVRLRSLSLSLGPGTLRCDHSFARIIHTAKELYAMQGVSHTYANTSTPSHTHMLTMMLMMMMPMLMTTATRAHAHTCDAQASSAKIIP